MQKHDSSYPPRWFIVVVVVTALPIVAYPLLWKYVNSNVIIGLNSDLFRLLINLLPIYIGGSAWLSYKVYVERPAVAWMLQALLILCYAACGWLVCVQEGFL